MNHEPSLPPPPPSKRPPTMSEVLDAELRMRGDSLAEFARARGYALLHVVAMIEGLADWDNDLLLDLGEAVGFKPARSAFLASPKDG